MDSLAARNVQDAQVNLGIVRGLDYYSGMVFEAFDQGEQNAALVGGGRYDKLTEAFGRKDIGAAGVAGGVERIVTALRRHGTLGRQTARLVYVAYAGEAMRRNAVHIASGLRQSGIVTEYDLVGRALKKQLDEASGKSASAAVIVAPEEYSSGLVIVKFLSDGREEKLPVEKLGQFLESSLRA
jgi:histidyl-tRNA synthetase